MRMIVLILLFLQDSLEKELPRLAPTEPKDAPRTFLLKPGFRLELVASEPLVFDPVDATFDEDGRLWVAEMADYPFGDKEKNPPQGRLVVLDDPDGDGRFDTRTVLAERLRWPTGLALWDGGAFVTSVPDVLYLKGDTKRVVFTGFSDQNVQGLLNNPRWGLDNWFHASSGTNGGTVAGLTLRNRDFRFRPGGELDALSGGGQFGNNFDDFGRRFVCSNSVQARHVVLEDAYLRRNPFYAVPAVVHSIAADGDSGPVFRASPAEPWRVVRTRLRKEGVVPGPIEHGGAVTGYFTSATGIFWHDGLLYIGDVSSNLVHRKRLVPAGSTFRAERVDEKSEFLSSRDNWFRPVNFFTGPDGALYVCDMYRECIEHPYSIPDSIKKHLDLTSGKDRGRLWRIVKEGAAPYRKPSLKTTEEQVAAIGRPEAWWRQTAARLLFRGQDRSAVAGLERLLSHERPETRVAALWALEGLGVRKGESLLRDPHPAVREHAVRLSSPEALFGLEEGDPRVRLEIAWKMGETKDPRAAAVLEKLKAGADRWLRTAIALSAGERSAAPTARQTAPVRDVGDGGDRGKVVDAYRKALSLKGDEARGREIYRKACVNCHKARGEGQDVGPDLATVKERTPEELLVAILDPNREVNPQFAQTRVKTKDGAVYVGILTTSTGTGFTLKLEKGETVTMLDINVEAKITSNLSLMPPDLEKTVDAQGMADLIAFLKSL
jgi:putative membrane-bound dehydrogenase-like protein